MKSQTVLVVPWDIELSLSVDDSFNPLNNTLPFPQKVFGRAIQLNNVLCLASNVFMARDSNPNKQQTNVESPSVVCDV